jgi:hypothetical protein
MSGISPQQKKDPRKKREREKRKREKEKREQVLKKQVKPHKNKIHVSKGEKKKKRIKFTSCWERFYQKKERKEITFSYSAKSDVWPRPYCHTRFYAKTKYSSYA